jgi:L-ascorbate metabolism protein UlaG (beta-lactamase superfamily)
MKRTLIFLLCIVIYTSAKAQLANPDTYNTKKGDLIIQPLIHASMILTWDSKHIYIDPSSIEELNFNFPKADIVFITDIHGDHLNIKSLKKIINSNTILVMPLAVQLKLKDANLKNTIITMRNNESKNVLGIRVNTIPMYNLPKSNKSYHVKGRGNGYVLDFKDKRVYISGDTADIKEMRNLKNIDIAFICMNLPYTMTVKKAASAVLDFKPKIVYPFHYRGKGGFSDVNKFKSIVNQNDTSIQVKLKNWYPKN